MLQLRELTVNRQPPRLPIRHIHIQRQTVLRLRADRRVAEQDFEAFVVRRRQAEVGTCWAMMRGIRDLRRIEAFYFVDGCGEVEAGGFGEGDIVVGRYAV